MHLNICWCFLNQSELYIFWLYSHCESVYQWNTLCHRSTWCLFRSTCYLMSYHYFDMENFVPGTLSRREHLCRVAACRTQVFNKASLLSWCPASHSSHSAGNDLTPTTAGCSVCVCVCFLGIFQRSSSPDKDYKSFTEPYSGCLYVLNQMVRQ